MRFFLERAYSSYTIYQNRRGQRFYLTRAATRSVDAFGFDQITPELEMRERDLPLYRVHSGSLNLSREWRNYGDYGADFDDFKHFLRAVLTDVETAELAQLCQRDGNVHTEGMVEVQDDGTNSRHACRTCAELYYRRCTVCEGLTRNWGNLVRDRGIACNPCLTANRYTYCSNVCGLYYPPEDAEEHLHLCCASPLLDFTIPNDGQEPLANDTRAHIVLAAGEIDSEGLHRIKQYLLDWGLNQVADAMDALGNQWQTKEGNFSKRLSRLAYKDCDTKISSPVLSQVGTIAAEHSRTIDFSIEVTRELNRPAEEFYNRGSCWWGGYNNSRCALKTNGGFGMLSYEAMDTDRATPNGRAWVMPLKRESLRNILVPTFDTRTPTGFVVFNGYGALEGYGAARILAYMAGMTYRKVDFATDSMFINAGGYLVAPEDVASRYDIGLYMDRHSGLFERERSVLGSFTIDLTIDKGSWTTIA